MRNFKSLQFYKAAIFMALLFIFSSSCKKDDPVLPDYVGTWVAMETVPTDNGDMSIKDKMTFTETTFSHLAQVQLTPGQWVDYISMKGSLSVSGSKMNSTITEVGISSFNMVTGLPTGSMTSYKAGTAEFDNLLLTAGQPKTAMSEYSVSGNQLSHKTDDNGDGDYLDEGETTVYTRQ